MICLVSDTQAAAGSWMVPSKNHMTQTHRKLALPCFSLKTAFQLVLQNTWKTFWLDYWEGIQKTGLTLVRIDRISSRSFQTFSAKESLFWKITSYLSVSLKFSSDHRYRFKWIILFWWTEVLPCAYQITVRCSSVASTYLTTATNHKRATLLCVLVRLLSACHC